LPWLDGNRVGGVRVFVELGREDEAVRVAWRIGRHLELHADCDEGFDLVGVVVGKSERRRQRSSAMRHHVEWPSKRMRPRVQKGAGR